MKNFLNSYTPRAQGEKRRRKLTEERKRPARAWVCSKENENFPIHDTREQKFIGGGGVRQRGEQRCIRLWSRRPGCKVGKLNSFQEFNVTFSLCYSILHSPLLCPSGHPQQARKPPSRQKKDKEPHTGRRTVIFLIRAWSCRGCTPPVVPQLPPQFSTGSLFLFGRKVLLRTVAIRVL